MKRKKQYGIMCRHPNQSERWILMNRWYDTEEQRSQAIEEFIQNHKYLRDRFSIVVEYGKIDRSAA